MYSIIKNAEQKNILNTQPEALRKLYKSLNRIIKNKMHEIAIEGIKELISIFITENDGYFKNFGLLFCVIFLS